MHLKTIAFFRFSSGGEVLSATWDIIKKTNTNDNNRKQFKTRYVFKIKSLRLAASSIRLSEVWKI